jgi:hypothetical protein
METVPESSTVATARSVDSQSSVFEVMSESARLKAEAP